MNSRRTESMPTRLNRNWYLIHNFISEWVHSELNVVFLGRSIFLNDISILFYVNMRICIAIIEPGASTMVQTAHYNQIEIEIGIEWISIHPQYLLSTKHFHISWYYYLSKCQHDRRIDTEPFYLSRSFRYTWNRFFVWLLRENSHNGRNVEEENDIRFILCMQNIPWTFLGKKRERKKLENAIKKLSIIDTKWNLFLLLVS